MSEMVKSKTRLDIVGDNNFRCDTNASNVGEEGGG